MVEITSVYISKSAFYIGGKNMRLTIELRDSKNIVVMHHDFLMAKVNDRDVKLAFAISKSTLKNFITP
jgi:predicted ATP-dependent protease